MTDRLNPTSQNGIRMGSSLRNVARWAISVAGAVVLVLISPLLLLLPVGLIVGGIAGGMTMIFIELVVGYDVNSHEELVWTSMILCATFAIFSFFRGALRIFLGRKVPLFHVIIRKATNALIFCQLPLQISVGAMVPFPFLLTFGDSRNMSGGDLLKTTLLALVVFIVTSVFVSYFMRSVIPWRMEKPGFSNSVAYTISILLGLIASTYAYYGAETLGAANELGKTLVQSSIALCTAVATLVGAYVAVVEVKGKGKEKNKLSADKTDEPN